MINFVFDFHFTEPWINSMDHDVITSEMLEQSTNNQFVNEEISEAYKNFNSDNSSLQHGVTPRPEGHKI